MIFIDGGVLNNYSGCFVWGDGVAFNLIKGYLVSNFLEGYMLL